MQRDTSYVSARGQELDAHCANHITLIGRSRSVTWDFGNSDRESNITHRHGNGLLLSAAYTAVAYALGRAIPRCNCKFRVSTLRARVHSAQFWYMRREKSLPPTRTQSATLIYANKCGTSRLYSARIKIEDSDNGVYTGREHCTFVTYGRPEQNGKPVYQEFCSTVLFPFVKNFNPKIHLRVKFI